MDLLLYFFFYFFLLLVSGCMEVFMVSVMLVFSLLHGGLHGIRHAGVQLAAAGGVAE